MAIDKKLIHFNKKEDFVEKLNKGEIKDISIVFIKDTKEIWTHGIYYSDLSDYATEQFVQDYSKIEDDEIIIGEETLTPLVLDNVGLPGQVLIKTETGYKWENFENLFVKYVSIVGNKLTINGIEITLPQFIENNKTITEFKIED